jgi:hypothetical protein
MQQKRGKFYLGERGRRIKIITAFIVLLILVAIAVIPPVLPLDSGGGSVITEATPCLAGEWIEKNHTPEVGAVGEAVVGTGDYIFIVWCRYYSTTPEFWRYDPSTDNWNDSMNVSGLPIGAFRNGAALAWDHGDYIYALLGGRYKDSNRTLFYRYCISNNTWIRLTDTPHAQCAGDAITWANSSIYAILGSRKHKTVFARYNCSNSSWSVLSLPDNWKNETDDGASLVWTGGTYLYALQGEVGEDENQPITSFSRYNITNNSSGIWEDMRPIPEIEGVGDGASLLWIGNWVEEYANYIFALGGGSGLTGEPPGNETPGNKSYTYCISEDKWNELEPIPCPVGKYVGNRLGFADGHIYYWQGTPKNTSKWICGGDAFLMFAQTGSISVSSYPSGAKIFLDGSYKGKTPRTIIDVEPGYHTIKLTLEGYPDWSKSVNVKEGETSYVNKTPPPIVINEVELNPPGDDRRSTTMEWVELYNPASKDVDLTGWTLSSTQYRGGKTINLFGTIKANGYSVFRRSLWLHNTKGESVILRDAGSKKIDSTPLLKDGPKTNDYRSWQRCPNGIDTDSYLDWDFRPSTKGYSNKCS